MKSPTETPKLVALADACNAGACNTGALIRSFTPAVEELPFCEIKDHPAVKVILGQISFLVGESLGPSAEALSAYESWRNAAATAAAA